MKQKIQAKIIFIEQQLEALNQYLPETHEFLMSELDTQMRLMAEIKIQQLGAS